MVLGGLWNTDQDKEIQVKSGEGGDENPRAIL
jgi:hypothetical protein